MDVATTTPVKCACGAPALAVLAPDSIRDGQPRCAACALRCPQCGAAAVLHLQTFRTTFVDDEGYCDDWLSEHLFPVCTLCDWQACRCGGRHLIETKGAA